MITRTKEEIEAFISKLFPSELPHHRILIVEPAVDGSIEIEATDMYGPPTFDFKRLKAISDFFDTTNIDTIDTISQEGCETCDWGSKYGSRIRIRLDEKMAS